jgi:hypothetical protein
MPWLGLSFSDNAKFHRQLKKLGVDDKVKELYLNKSTRGDLYKKWVQGPKALDAPVVGFVSSDWLQKLFSYKPQFHSD